MGIKTVEVSEQKFGDDEIANRLKPALVSLEPDLRFNLISRIGKGFSGLNPKEPSTQIKLLPWELLKNIH
jgi:hypothetical protein